MTWIRIIGRENVDVWCRIVGEESSGRFDYYVIESDFYNDNEYAKTRVMKELVEDREVCEL